MQCGLWSTSSCSPMLTPLSWLIVPLCLPPHPHFILIICLGGSITFNLKISLRWVGSRIILQLWGGSNNPSTLRWFKNTSAPSYSALVDSFKGAQRGQVCLVVWNLTLNADFMFFSVFQGGSKGPGKEICLVVWNQTHQYNKCGFYVFFFNQDGIS